MTLKIVPKSAPTAKQAVIERVKKLPRPDGMLQCNRCGGRESLTAVAGAVVKNGRVQGGTVTARHECATCWKQGIHSPMLPEIERIK